MALPSVPAGEPSPRHEKVTAFISRSSAAAEAKMALTDEADLDAFGSEEPTRAETAAAVLDSGRERRLWLTGRLVTVALAAVAAVVLGISAAVWFGPALMRQFPAAGGTGRPGRVTIGTTPIGAEVSVDGRAHGLTPLTVQLDPGTHMIKLRRGTEERTVAVQVASGAEVLQHYEFAPQVVAVQTSTLAITTDPPGARVMIDGEARGTSPVTVPDLSAGRHRVTVVGENGSVERQVTTEAGITSSVVFALPRAAAVAAGWLSVASPFEVQVLERGEVIGTSASPRFMVPAGAHDIELTNDALGFTERRRIDIRSGATASVKIDAQASISANARPWAEVIVDGRSVGQTPLANLSLALGTHEIVFRHPDLGERKQTIVVTAKGPNRIAVDLTR
jgi:hypothetical protein